MKSQTNKILLKASRECTGCGACSAVCPRGAIERKPAGFGAWIPKIDPTLCVQCRLCEMVCHAEILKHTAEKKSYIAYNQNREMRLLSASGGAFSALASYVLKIGGCVFGAELRFEDGQAVAEHRMVTRTEDLPKILGSKYVESDCSKAYLQVKKELQKGRTVLFSGCSCQIAGLKRYLGELDQTNLYTADLICHGVPGISLFRDYIKFLEKKHGGQIVRLSFRTKVQGETHFEVSATLEGAEKKEIKIPMEKSGYFRMFITEECYREACYQCSYASLDKPADLTLGDYFEAKEDYPQFFVGEDAIDCNGGISCVIAHSDRGQALLQKVGDALFLREVDPKVVQASHKNLHKPSAYSKTRSVLKTLYAAFGYASVEAMYNARAKLMKLLGKK